MSDAAITDPADPQYPQFLLPEVDRPAPEIEVVSVLKVACMGEHAKGMGHPRVWLAIVPEIGFVDCGYCDKRFILAPLAIDAH